MPKKYTIREGFSFVDDSNNVKSGGEIVELEDDVAANHAHKLELVAEKAPAKTTKQAETPTSVMGATLIAGGDVSADGVTFLVGDKLA